MFDYSNLDAGLLQSVYSIRDTILQAIFDRSGAKELKVDLDDFRNLVKRLCASGELSCGIVVHDRPLGVFIFGDLSVCEAQRSKTFSGVIFQMDKSRFGEFLILCQALENDGISAFCVESDSTVGTSDDCRHAFPGRVEFADIQNLELLRPAIDLDENRLGFARLYSQLSL